jgi:hypothetical protein
MLGVANMKLDECIRKVLSSAAKPQEMSNGFGADMGKLCELLVCVKVIISSACPAKHVTACKDSGLCRIMYNLTGCPVFAPLSSMRPAATRWAMVSGFVSD